MSDDSASEYTAEDILKGIGRELKRANDHLQSIRLYLGVMLLITLANIVAGYLIIQAVEDSGGGF